MWMAALRACVCVCERACVAFSTCLPACEVYLGIFEAPPPTVMMYPSIHPSIMSVCLSGWVCVGLPMAHGTNDRRIDDLHDPLLSATC